MTYTNKHTKDECDKCLVNVGKENLKRVPFLYLDRNDKIPEDMGYNYRQYFVCEECFKNGV